MAIQWHKGDLVEIGVLPGGKLLIALTSEGWQYRKDIETKRDQFGINTALGVLFEDLCCNGWDYDTCDCWGNMSNASALTDVFDPEDYEEYTSGSANQFWYSSNYQIKDEIEQIYANGYLVWEYWALNGKTYQENNS